MTELGAAALREYTVVEADYQGVLARGQAVRVEMHGCAVKRNGGSGVVADDRAVVEVNDCSSGGHATNAGYSGIQRGI